MEDEEYINSNIRQLNIDKELQNEELARLTKINNDLRDIRDIQQHLSYHIENDNQQLENISNNIESSDAHIVQANEDLELSLKYKSYKWIGIVAGSTIGAITLGPIGGGIILGLKATGILALTGAGLLLGGGASNTVC